jgi:hypothetical protein
MDEVLAEQILGDNNGISIVECSREFHHLE